MGSIPGSGRSPGGGNGNPLHFFLPGKSKGQRSLVDCGPRRHKEWDTAEETEQQRRSYVCNIKVTEHVLYGFFPKVAQSCPTLCDPMDDIVRGLLQTRILEWVTYPFSSGSSRPRNWTALQVDSLPAELPGNPIYIYIYIYRIIYI